MITQVRQVGELTNGLIDIVNVFIKVYFANTVKTSSVVVELISCMSKISHAVLNLLELLKTVPYILLELFLHDENSVNKTIPHQKFAESVSEVNQSIQTLTFILTNEQIGIHQEDYTHAQKKEAWNRTRKGNFGIVGCWLLVGC